MGTFIPTYSTDNIWREENMEQCLSDDLNTIEADIAALETGKAAAVHTHTGYAATTDVTALQTLVGDTPVSTQISTATSGKADINHTHTGYALENHEHTNYAAASDMDALETLVGTTSVASQISSAVGTKANINHSHVLADLGIQHGRVTVSCTANEVSSASVTFSKTYTSAPTITLTAGSSAPGTAVSEVCVSNVTTTGFDVRVYRTNTSVTTVHWIAVGNV